MKISTKIKKFVGIMAKHPEQKYLLIIDDTATERLVPLWHVVGLYDSNATPEQLSDDVEFCLTPVPKKKSKTKVSA